MNPVITNFCRQWYVKRVIKEKERDALLYRKIKTSLFKNIKSPVLEIGYGAGNNFAFLPHKTRWFGVDVNNDFNNLVLLEAKKHHIAIEEINNCSAEELSFADGYFSTVIGTHVLCSVDNPIIVLQEIKRVLRKQGRFLFLEHVCSADKGERLLQSLLTPATKVLSGNCHLNRDTGELIRTAGFSRVIINKIRIGPKHIATQIVGDAQVL